MKPFSLLFKEKAFDSHPDYSLVRYDETLNLNVIRQTGIPAVHLLQMETTTFTKATGEGSDSDRDRVARLLDTSTRTLTHAEVSDTDTDRKSIFALLDTATLTEAREDTDQDK